MKTSGQRLVLGPRRALKRITAPVREATTSSARPWPGIRHLASATDALAENVVLRQQLLVLRRQVKRPALTRMDRFVIVGASALTSTWRDSLLLVKPETVLRWHRQAFQAIWRWKSRRPQQPRVELETIELIRRMARENRLWGAERIRGELLKLGIRVTKRTIQRNLRSTSQPRPNGQRWATFLKNHSKDVWTCAFLQTYDVRFRPIFAFFIVNVGTREVVHVAVTRAPTSEWTTQQLRNATPSGTGPRFHHSRPRHEVRREFRPCRRSGRRSSHQDRRAPDMNATCGRFLGSARRESKSRIFLVPTSR